MGVQPDTCRIISQSAFYENSLRPGIEYAHGVLWHSFICRRLVKNPDSATLRGLSLGGKPISSKLLLVTLGTLGTYETVPHHMLPYISGSRRDGVPSAVPWRWTDRLSRETSTDVH